MADLKVGIDALHSDANAWSDAGRALKQTQDAVASLHLTGYDVMIYGERRGIDRQYNEAREKLLDMMMQASENFYNISFALTVTALEYEEDEAERARNMRDAGER